ncbi:MAG: hypothetical protein ACJ762_06970 [Solirubrobacteraceae bacterium]
MRSAILPLAALVLLAAGAGGAQARRDHCNGPGARTVALTDQARVIQDDADGYYYGCDRRTGRRTELWEQDDIYTEGSVRAVAGRFVAYRVASVPACKADCPPGVTGSFVTSVTDVRTGRTRDLHDGTVYALLLRASGTVAWVAEPAPGSTLSVWALGGPASLLDEGDIHAVRARGGTLTWTNADGEHSAPLPGSD